MVDNVTVEKITKTVEIEYSSNNQYKNYYSINNGEIWQEYTKAIQLSENCTIKAKSIINGGNGIEKQTETEKEIYIIDKLIPTMISNTTNENNEEMAKITADSYYSSEYMPYFAFDKDNVSAWCSEANAKYPHSLYYEFTDGKVRSIKKVEFVTIFDSWHNEYEVQVFGTNDDITWDEITNKITIPLNYGEQSIVTDSINKNAYKKFKFTCYGYAYSTLKDVAIWEVQLYGYSI